MSENLRKNGPEPSKENKEFLFGLLYQYDNESLHNFIASNFNSINISIRKHKVYEWIHSIKWLLFRFDNYDTVDFHNSFCIEHFHDEVDEGDFECLDNVLNFFENLQDYQDLQLVGKEAYNEVEMEKDAAVHYTYFEKYPIFSKYSPKEQRHILEVYEWHKIEEENFFNSDTIKILNLSASTNIQKILSSELNRRENLAIIDEVCNKFIQINEANPNKFSEHDTITDLLNIQIKMDGNMNLLAYYLQYICLSLGTSIPNNLNSFGVSKVSGKQADIMQRLLCSVTNKKWDTTYVKGNSYYKAVNNMFKIDKDISEDKIIILKHLEKVREMLTIGGFKDAIMILDEDYEKIKAYK